MSTLSQKQLNIWVYTTILIGIFFQIYAVSCGVNLTYDSHNYITATNSLRSGIALYNADGTLYVQHPPLFPSILTLLSFLHHNHQLMWTIFNILNLAFCLYVIYKLSRKIIHHPVVLLLLMFSQVFSVSYLMIHSFLWSEPFFFLLLVLILDKTYDYLHNLQNTTLIQITILSFLLALQRIPGVFFIAGIGISFLFLLPQKRYFAFKKASLFMFLASIGWITWLIVVFYLKGWRFHSATETAFQNFFINIYEYANVFTAWFLPINIPFILRLITFIVGILWVLWFFQKTIQELFKSKFIITLLIVFGTYTLALLNLEHLDYYESERYYSFAYFPSFLIFFLLVDKIFVQISSLKQKILIVVLGIWLLYPIYRSVRNVQLWHYKSCVEKERNNID